jgi:hypothetical protein
VVPLISTSFVPIGPPASTTGWELRALRTGGSQLENIGVARSMSGMLKQQVWMHQMHADQPNGVGN